MYIIAYDLKTSYKRTNSQNTSLFKWPLKIIIASYNIKYQGIFREFLIVYYHLGHLDILTHIGHFAEGFIQQCMSGMGWSRWLNAMAIIFWWLFSAILAPAFRHLYCGDDSVPFLRLQIGAENRNAFTRTNMQWNYLKDFLISNWLFHT